MSKHYVNEVGTVLYLDTGLNLVSFNGGAGDVGLIKYKKPDGTTIGSWTATLYSSYSTVAEATGTYFLQKSIAAGDLDQSGDWKFQAYVALVAGTAGTWYGETVKETIFDAFE